MNDHIRKAVELADGFAPEALQISKTEDMVVGFEEQFFLDALAAQLCRQVDALPMLWVCVENDTSCVQHGELGTRAAERGPDRTMNCIKAIVDSGVLDID